MYVVSFVMNKRNLMYFLFSIFREPDNVMMCILREGDRNDISVKIQHTLIEAYCWENDIRVLKVSPEDKLDVMLANELNLNRSKEENSCALVMLPNKDTTTEELSEDDGWIQTDILLPGWQEVARVVNLNYG